jgi:hypothetical protein
VPSHIGQIDGQHTFSHPYILGGNQGMPVQAFTDCLGKGFLMLLGKKIFWN